MPPFQKINTVLIPEFGLDLVPPFVQEAQVSTDFSRVLAHLVGKGPNSGVLIRSTTDGSLRVAIAGVPFEIYVISDGTERPYRAKIRTPSFVNLMAVPGLLKGYLIADAIALFAIFEPVLGEVDR